MERTVDVVAAGHICLDIAPIFPALKAERVNDILKPGKLVNVQPAVISLGGPVANTGLALKKFGLKVIAAAGVGEDQFGAIAVELLREAGVGDAIQPAAGATTSYTIVLAPPGIDRIFLHSPGKNDDFSIDDINWNAVADARLFHLGYPPLMRSLYERNGQLIEAIFSRAKECGAATSLDMSLPDPASESGRASWSEILEKVLPLVDIFMPSIEELYFMLEKESYLELRRQHPDADLVEWIPPATYARLADRALAFGCGLCIIKTARRGYYLRSGEPQRLTGVGAAGLCPSEDWSRRELWAPAYRVPAIVSATGSGDSSIAGFLTAFLNGLPPERCLRLANAAGHHNLLAMDALSGLPSWDGLNQFVDRGPATEDPHLAPEMFQFDAGLGIYRGLGDRVPVA